MNSSIDMSPATPSPATKGDRKERRFVLFLLAVFVFGNLFVAAVAALLLEQSRARELQQAEATTANLAEVLEENLAGLIGKIDLTLLAVRDEIDRQRAAGAIDSATVNALLARYNVRITDSLGLRVTDSDGVIRHAVGGVAITQANIADRPQFILMRDNPGVGLVISKPVFGRTSQAWLMTFSRRLNNRDGSFAGDVHVSVTLDHLTKIFSRLMIGPHGAVALWNDEPTLLARYTSMGGFTHTVGGVAPSAVLAPALVSGLDSFRYRANSGSDQILRTYAMRKVGSSPLSVVVGVADEDALSEWRRTAKLMAGLFLMFFVATASLSVVVYRGWRRRADHTAAVERSRSEAERHAEVTAALGDVLRLALEDQQLDGLLNAALTRLLSLRVFSLERQGGIFLIDAADGALKLAAEQGFSSEIRTACASVRPGHCLCGRAAITGQVVFADDVDGRHETVFPGMPDHGHYCVPIISAGAIIGVLNVYVPAGHIRNADEESFLTLAADTLAGIITRWRIGESLRQSEELARALMNASSDAAFLTDGDGTVLAANEALAARFGRRLEELLGQSFLPLIPPALAEARRAQYQEVIRTGTPFHGQDERDGMILDNRVYPVHGESGRVTRLAVFSRDVTASQLAERQNRELLSYQRAILGNSAIGIGLFDLDRRIMATNDAFCRIFGRRGEDLRGQSARVLYGDAATFEDLGQRAYPVVQAGGSFGDDVPMIRRDGSEVWAHLTARMVDMANPALGVVWTAEDITQRKRLELDLKRSNEELERFAYVASHDLRQPLRMVSSYLGLIVRRMQGRLGEDEREFLAFAVDGAKRMDAMILDLLEYSRIGRQGPAADAVLLSDAVSAALVNLEGAIGDSGAEVVVAPDLPTVVGYQSELERLFQNLIGNAVKFRSPDRRPMVTVSCRDTARDWVLVVADNGIGIAAEDQARLFMIFQRLVSREQYEGTGIGLAACRKIAEHHGGRIWVESTPGEGSAFLVALPKRSDQATSTSTISASSAASMTSETSPSAASPERSDTITPLTVTAPLAETR